MCQARLLQNLVFVCFSPALCLLAFVSRRVAHTRVYACCQSVQQFVCCGLAANAFARSGTSICLPTRKINKKFSLVSVCLCLSLALSGCDVLQETCCSAHIRLFSFILHFYTQLNFACLFACACVPMRSGCTQTASSRLRTPRRTLWRPKTRKAKNSKFAAQRCSNWCAGRCSV